MHGGLVNRASVKKRMRNCFHAYGQSMSGAGGSMGEGLGRVQSPIIFTNTRFFRLPSNSP
jgi:hypothetical protein